MDDYIQEYRKKMHMGTNSINALEKLRRQTEVKLFCAEPLLCSDEIGCELIHRAREMIEESKRIVDAWDRRADGFLLLFAITWFATSFVDEEFGYGFLATLLSQILILLFIGEKFFLQSQLLSSLRFFVVRAKIHALCLELSTICKMLHAQSAAMTNASGSIASTLGGSDIFGNGEQKSLEMKEPGARLSTMEEEAEYHATKTIQAWNSISTISDLYVPKILLFPHDSYQDAVDVTDRMCISLRLKKLDGSNADIERDELLSPNCSVAVVTGPRGIGKSCALRNIAWHATVHLRWLTLYFDVNLFPWLAKPDNSNDNDSNNAAADGWIESLISATIGSMPGIHNDRPDMLEEWAAAIRFLVKSGAELSLLLDGLDDVPPLLYDRIVGRLQKIAKVILTKGEYYAGNNNSGGSGNDNGGGGGSNSNSSSENQTLFGSIRLRHMIVATRNPNFTLEENNNKTGGSSGIITNNSSSNDGGLSVSRYYIGEMTESDQEDLIRRMIADSNLRSTALSIRRKIPTDGNALLLHLMLRAIKENRGGNDQATSFSSYAVFERLIHWDISSALKGLPPSHPLSPITVPALSKIVSLIGFAYQRCEDTSINGIAALLQDAHRNQILSPEDLTVWANSTGGCMSLLKQVCGMLRTISIEKGVKVPETFLDVVSSPSPMLYRNSSSGQYLNSDKAEPGDDAFVPTLDSETPMSNALPPLAAPSTPKDEEIDILVFAHASISQFLAAKWLIIARQDAATISDPLFSLSVADPRVLSHPKWRGVVDFYGEHIGTDVLAAEIYGSESNVQSSIDALSVHGIPDCDDAGHLRSMAVFRALSLTSSGPLSARLFKSIWDQNRIVAVSMLGDCPYPEGIVEALSQSFAEDLTRHCIERNEWQILVRCGPVVAGKVQVAFISGPATLRSSALAALESMSDNASGAVRVLGGMLLNSDEQLRTKAVDILARLGEHSSNAAPLLASLLTDAAPGIRALAIRAIQRLGGKAASAVPTLLNLFQSGNDVCRDSIAAALGSIGSAPQFESRSPRLEAMPALVQLLYDDNAVVRETAADALKGFGGDAASALEPLEALLCDEDPCVRLSAAEALGGIGHPAAATAQAVRKLLADAHSTVRLSAGAAFGRLISDSSMAMPVLVALLKDEDPNVRENALYALGSMGEHAIGAGPVVAELLKDRDAGVRESAARALGQLGPHAGGAASVLAELLLDEDGEVRASATVALKQMKSSATAAVPTLELLLQDREAQVRCTSAEILGFVGPGAAESCPLLAALLDDPSVKVADTAVATLKRLAAHASSAIPILQGLLASSKAPVKLRAADVLGVLGGGAKKASPALAQLLTDPDGIVRVKAADSLSAMSVHAATAIPVLIPLLLHSNAVVRSAAVECLGNACEGGEGGVELSNSVLQSMLPLLGDVDVCVRAATVKAITKICPVSGGLGDIWMSAANAIAARLEDADEDGLVRQRSCTALGMLGRSHMERPLTTLTAALKDRSAEVRNAAFMGLKSLGSKAVDTTPWLLAHLKSAEGTVQVGDFA